MRLNQNSLIMCLNISNLNSIWEKLVCYFQENKHWICHSLVLECTPVCWQNFLSSLAGNVQFILEAEISEPPMTKLISMKHLML